MKMEYDKYEENEIPKFVIKKFESLNEEEIKEIHYVEPKLENYYFYENNKKLNYFNKIEKEIDHYLILKKDHTIEYRLKSKSRILIWINTYLL